ncbi:MAG: hypothetical protein KDK62_01875 [Chlamydiia bacterium]|nr:hypothetical protein [Chlamydiia bacterium]
MKFIPLLLLCPLTFLAAWEGHCCEDENCQCRECCCHERNCLFQEVPLGENTYLRDEAYWPTKMQDPLIDSLTK